MPRATLGFSRATRARTRQDPYPYTRVRVLISTGQGLGITHGYQNPRGFETRVHIKRDGNMKRKLSNVPK